MVNSKGLESSCVDSRKPGSLNRPMKHTKTFCNQLVQLQIKFSTYRYSVDEGLGALKHLSDGE